MKMGRAGHSLLAWGLGGLFAGAAWADTWQPLEQWRIDNGNIAPWAAPGTKIDSVYRGREVRFQLARVTAPNPIACDGARYEWIFVDADGLFEGNLPKPAGVAARRLGLDAQKTPTLRVACTNAGFDFHRNSDGDLLLGLDNVVWTLRAARSATTPAETVQELLIQHFSHDMAFTRESVALKRVFVSADLRARINAWFGLTRSPDEVPAINGDPFTGSQEYPDRFTLGIVRTAPQRTTVQVNFADEQSKRRVDYVMVNEGSRWVVDDLVDERGQSLRRLLGTTTGAGARAQDPDDPGRWQAGLRHPAF